MRLYLAGPMRGYPEFNFPAFHAAAAKLRAHEHVVFSPAERDMERHGADISKGNPTGDEQVAAKEHGFDLRVALREDLEWICNHAEGIALLPGWRKSKGATAEYATAVALGLAVIELTPHFLTGQLVRRRYVPLPNGHRDYGKCGDRGPCGHMICTCADEAACLAKQAEMTSTSKGLKFDGGKRGFTLLPFDALGCIQKVLDFGAKKYAARNWELGMEWTRPWDACIRHLDAWMRREPADPESGFSHLWHAGCCIVFLIAYELRGVGDDNRPPAAKTPESK